MRRIGWLAKAKRSTEAKIGVRAPKVDVVGRLFSPAGSLKTLLRSEPLGAKDAGSLIAGPGSAAAGGESIGARHRRMPGVVEAVEQVLTDRGKPMQAREPRFVRLPRSRYRRGSAAPRSTDLTATTSLVP